MRDLFAKYLMSFCFAGIGVVAIVAFVCVTLDKWRMKNEEWRMNGHIFHSPFFILHWLVPIICVCGMVLYGSTKGHAPTNEPPSRTQMVRRTGGAAGLQSAEPPVSNALVRVEKWWRRGAYDDGQVLAFDGDWRFPYGGNHWTSVEIWASGAVYPSQKSPTPLVALDTKLSLRPHGSEVFAGRTTNDTYRIEWHNAHPNRDANQTADAAIELKRNGDALVTENGVTTLVPYVCPDDLDGDGILNEEDEHPTVNDGSFFGAANRLPEGCNSNAYCFVDIVIAGADAKVEFVGDGPSNYPDPRFMAKEGETNRVVLLIGKSYDVVCREAVVCTGRSDDAIEVCDGDLGALRVQWPVRVVCDEMAGRSRLRRAPSSEAGRGARCVGAITVSVSPNWLNGTFSWDAGVCCPITMNGDVLSYDGQSDCRCGGCVTQGYYTYEGYRLPAWTSNCGCGPYEGSSPYLSSTVDSEYVFFDKGDSADKSTYVACDYRTDSPGTFRLSVSGDSVGVADETGFSFDSGGTWRVESSGSGRRRFCVSRAEKSASADGTHLAFSFIPDQGGTALSSECSVVFVEVSTLTFARKPQPRTRRRLGIGEVVRITIDPVLRGSLLTSENPGSTIVRARSAGSWNYYAGYAAATDVVRIAGMSSSMVASFSIVEPDGYDAKLRELSVFPELGLSGSYSLVFDLKLSPADVSFSALDVIEVGAVSTNAVGYFALPEHAHMLDHSNNGADFWSEVREDESLSDFVAVAELLPPWNSGGSFTWPIPNEWRVRSNHSICKEFCYTDQRVELESDGTTRVSKFGYTCSCTTNRISTVTVGGLP